MQYSANIKTAQRASRRKIEQALRLRYEPSSQRDQLRQARPDQGQWSLTLRNLVERPNQGAHLDAHGVRLVAGTDGSGMELVRELELSVPAGLTL